MIVRVVTHQGVTVERTLSCEVVESDGAGPAVLITETRVSPHPDSYWGDDRVTVTPIEEIQNAQSLPANDLDNVERPVAEDAPVEEEHEHSNVTDTRSVVEVDVPPKKAQRVSFLKFSTAFKKAPTTSPAAFKDGTSSAAAKQIKKKRQRSGLQAVGTSASTAEQPPENDVGIAKQQDTSEKTSQSPAPLPDSQRVEITQEPASLRPAGDACGPVTYERRAHGQKYADITAGVRSTSWKLPTMDHREMRAERDKHEAQKNGNMDKLCGGDSKASKPRHSEMPPLPLDGERIWQKNEGEWEFTLLESEDQKSIVLDVAIGKYLDTSLVELDVQPKLVRMLVKGKLLQLELMEEVNPDKSNAQRATISGHLVA
ncbi:hypothetical protein CYMTET_8704 [Cymbomonas tetramitiformis]|uniref:Dynein axonemal assembly factor 11-like CS domain-containing protein n=1 Tax=Cymbomonas tetramitiformis TaxID=36881 RepID=A0AAE0GT37_9CHLO|nr:hypothetical protein CYMTET_8704 [Cymbomonas tetramitiformis]